MENLPTIDRVDKCSSPKGQKCIPMPIDEAWEQAGQTRDTHHTLDSVQQIILLESKVKTILLEFKDSW